MQVSCFYHLKYEMDEAKAARVARTVAHILLKKGYGKLIRNEAMLAERDEL